MVRLGIRTFRATSPLLVQLSRAILAEATISFLGFGIQPPAPTWGNLLIGVQNYVYTAPWLALAPGLAITGTLLLISTFGIGGSASRRMREPWVRDHATPAARTRSVPAVRAPTGLGDVWHIAPAVPRRRQRIRGKGGGWRESPERPPVGSCPIRRAGARGEGATHSRSEGRPDTGRKADHGNWEGHLHRTQSVKLPLFESHPGSPSGTKLDTGRRDCRLSESYCEKPEVRVRFYGKFGGPTKGTTRATWIHWPVGSVGNSSW